MTAGFILRLLIVDDERVARSRLRSMLADVDGVRVVGEAPDGVAALEQIEALAPDVVLLDVEMPKLNGIEVARSLRSRHPPQCVFVTAYDRYAIDAFELAAVDYLLKPVRLERLVTALNRARIRHARLPRQDLTEPLRRLGGLPFRRVVVRHRTGLKVLPAADLFWCDVGDKLVYANTAEGRFLTDYTLAELEAGLDRDSFCRVHRGFIVNLNRISELRSLIHGTWQLVLANGTKIPVSRRYAPMLKERLHR